MFESFESRLMLSGTLTTRTALRIGAGRATAIVGTDLPVVRDALGRPYIPGSSFKGALRAFVESLVRSVNCSAACNPLVEKEWCVPDAEGLDDDQIEENTCLVCRVFGSPWIASKVSIRDMLVDESLWFGQFEVRNGVAIDRDTETAGAGLLYDFEVVPAGSQFHGEIVVENAADWERGMLMAGLRSFELGEAALGGGRSRGLGLVKLEFTSRRLISRHNVLDYIGGDQPAGDITDAEIGDWIKAFRSKLGGQPNAQTTVQ
jgi:CRISPR-associated RAMP protein (TIGR02581 family)